MADLFPMMTEDEYMALRNDIDCNGLREPIWLHPDGRIIDGRNRYRACCDIGLMPEFRTWDGNGSLVAFVVSLNLQRRHLTSSQRAAIALDILPMLEAEARERQGRRTDLTSVNSLTEVEPQRATNHAAAMLNTNRQYVSDAKRIAQEAPALLERVKNGEVSIQQAKWELVRRRSPQPPAFPSGKYRVIYADPPWRYGNTQPEYHGVQADHYPLMTINELCNFPVWDIAEENAVLFLWVTSPILEEAFRVIRSWGFQYKTSFVWDKISHNMGHYNSVRHEFLLVCVRGSCQPDVPKLFDSVQQISRTAHSVKPEEFRQIIDTIYPHGARVELFARHATPGWDVYGNELQPTTAISA